MTNQNNIQDELRSLNSSLPVVNSQNVFSVPNGYFDGLAESILAKIKEKTTSVPHELKELSPFLAGLPKTMPYTVPAGYFEQNGEALPGLINENESPVLSSIGKQLPYDVPAGYFENLPQQLVNRIAKPEAKVVPLFALKWMRAAVAAVIGGMMVIGGYQLFNNNRQENNTARYQPADSSKTQVASNEPSFVIKEIRKASNKELEDFIHNTQALNTTKLRKQEAKPDNKMEVEQLLKDVPASEIDAFLDQIPTTDDDLSVTD